MSTEETKPKANPSLQALSYQPAFDGLRFLGVTAFVMGHAGLMTNQRQLIPFGWWMAVDMFFVISGYLITTLLLREWSSHGRINLKAFYVRRAARLYPLIFAVVVISIFQQLIRPDAQATPSWSAIFSMAFYYSNFQQLANPHDLLNSWSSLWSLAIEEQFYLIWPTVLILLLGRTFNLRRPLIVVSVLAVAMWIYRASAWLSMANSNPDFQDLAAAWRSFYYSTFHRPDGLLVGCAIAIILAMPRTPFIQTIIDTAHRVRFVTIPAVLVIITRAAVDEHAGWQVCWGLALFNLLFAGILIDLIEFRDSRLAHILSNRPFIWVGRRSYGVYIIHLALLMLFIQAFGNTSLPWVFAVIALIIALAGLSYRYYEDPLRRIGYRFSKRLMNSETSGPT